MEIYTQAYRYFDTRVAQRLAESWTPEFIRFDQVVNGQSLRTHLSGVDYYRFFTP